MSRTTIAAVATGVIAVAAIAGFLVYQDRGLNVRPGWKPPQVAEAPAPAPAPAAAASEPPAIQYPIEAAAGVEVALPPLDRSDKPLAASITSLIGPKAMASFVQGTGIVRHTVATVDNLARQHAAPSMWPVNPTGGRFTVSGPDGSKVISADNGQRYAPLLVMAESLNTQHAAAIYIRYYPLFQQAYEELGYPGKYFNDRLVAVIDHLLAAPEPSSPPRVVLTEVKGERKQQQPWIHYEFADENLQALSSGQKVLVRMGPVNERRMKAKLRELRAAVTSPTLSEQHGAASKSVAPVKN